MTVQLTCQCYGTQASSVHVAVFNPLTLSFYECDQLIK